MQVAQRGASQLWTGILAPALGVSVPSGLSFTICSTGCRERGVPRSLLVGRTKQNTGKARAPGTKLPLQDKGTGQPQGFFGKEAQEPPGGSISGPSPSFLSPGGPSWEAEGTRV